MIREDDAIFFTDQDKKNLLVRRYTSEELTNKERAFRKKRTTRRCILLILVVVDIALMFLFEQLEYSLQIILAFLVFLVILNEYIDRVNLKAIRREFYVEIEVKEHLKIEVILEQTLSPGSKATTFYPVRGVDTETGYESIFYVSKEQYDAEVGDRIRISTRFKEL